MSQGIWKGGMPMFSPSERLMRSSASMKSCWKAAERELQSLSPSQHHPLIGLLKDMLGARPRLQIAPNLSTKLVKVSAFFLEQRWETGETAAVCPVLQSCHHILLCLDWGSMNISYIGGWWLCQLLQCPWEQQTVYLIKHSRQYSW